MTEPNQDTTKPTPPADEPKPPVVNMTQEQLDKIIDQAYARGARNSADAKKLQALESEKTDLEKKLSEATKASEGADDKTSQKELQKLQQQLEALDTRSKELEQKLVE